MLAISGIKVTIAAKAYPVDHEEKSPQKIQMMWILKNLQKLSRMKN